LNNESEVATLHCGGYRPLTERDFMENHQNSHAINGGNSSGTVLAVMQNVGASIVVVLTRRLPP
jgi:hypothetical protein